MLRQIIEKLKTESLQKLETISPKKLEIDSLIQKNFDLKDFLELSQFASSQLELIFVTSATASDSGGGGLGGLSRKFTRKIVQ